MLAPSKPLDYLAEEVLTTFAELGFDPHYIEDKRHTLAGKDRFSVLVWLNNLDSGCRGGLKSNGTKTYAKQSYWRL